MAASPIARQRQTTSGLLKHIGLLIAFLDFLKNKFDAVFYLADLKLKVINFSNLLKKEFDKFSPSNSLEAKKTMMRTIFMARDHSGRSSNAY